MQCLPDHKGGDEGIKNDRRGPEALPEGLALTPHRAHSPLTLPCRDFNAALPRLSEIMKRATITYAKLGLYGDALRHGHRLFLARNLS